MANYLIVGGSSGIGFELADLLSKQNHNVHVLSRTERNLSTLPNTIHYAVDISEVEPAFPEITQPIDGIVYCPGTINLKPFKAFKPEDFQHDFNINVLGAVKTIKQYLPQLQQAQHPAIVLFSTVAASTGMAFHASIAAAKGAIEGLTKSLAAEFAPKIRVNAIAPSLTQTPLAEKLLNTESKVTAASERHPLKRVGTAQELAQAALFLLQAQWITGQILPVDGGISTLK
jgi:NAD(P)-dependent dehydrogenase (short-subunit alcohol dehydrogenase family)